MSAGHKRERKYRECGLLFAWKVPDSSSWASFASIVIVALLTTVLLGAVRVRIVPPPRVIERKASTVLVPEYGEGREWSVRAEEGGPFPSKFTPSESPVVKAMETDLIEKSLSEPYQPRLADFVEDTRSLLTVAPRGERVFPRSSEESIAKPVASTAPLMPMIRPLSTLPPGAWPESLPRFDADVTPKMAAATWRFMVEIGERGRVMNSISLDGTALAGSDEAAASARMIGDWLSQVRFGPAAVGAGWIGVEVGFSRKP